MKLQNLLETAQDSINVEEWYKRYLQYRISTNDASLVLNPDLDKQAIVIMGGSSLSFRHLATDSMIRFPFVDRNGDRSIGKLEAVSIWCSIIPDNIINTLPIPYSRLTLASEFSNTVSGLFDDNILQDELILHMPRVKTLVEMGKVTVNSLCEITFTDLSTYKGLDQFTVNGWNCGIVVPYLNEPLVFPVDPTSCENTHETIRAITFTNKPSCDVLFDTFLPKLYNYNIKHNTYWGVAILGATLSQTNADKTWDADHVIFDAYKLAKTDLERDDVLQDAYDDFKEWYSSLV